MKKQPGFVNRLDEVFQKKSSNILNIYVTAGYPHIENTTTLVLELQNSGADIIEIGIPYSDPIADGPVIQNSNQQALMNGMTVPVLFEQLKSVKDSVSVPLVLMGYLNSAIRFGFEKFCKEASASGVSAVILPDMPAYEYKNRYRKIFERYNLHFIFLVTPETSVKRIMEADRLSSGFLYAVSSSSLTGSEGSAIRKQEFFERLGSMKLKNPVLIGFGINNRESFLHACKYGQGAIIGSAFIRSLQPGKDPVVATRKFMDSILG